VSGQLTPQPLYPRGKPYPLDRRFGGPQSRSGRLGENSWPYRDSNSDPSVVLLVVSRYTDCAILAHVIKFCCVSCFLHLRCFFFSNLRLYRVSKAINYIVFLIVYFIPETQTLRKSHVSGHNFTLIGLYFDNIVPKYLVWYCFIVEILNKFHIRFSPAKIAVPLRQHLRHSCDAGHRLTYCVLVVQWSVKYRSNLKAVVLMFMKDLMAVVFKV
jgi:hypothetical protein